MRLHKIRTESMPNLSVGVVIPCFRVRSHIAQVLEQVGPEVTRIYLVDDACPEESGRFASEHCSDERLVVLTHQENLGVGGATMTGYKAALEDGMDVIVKLDGDGQMDPKLIPTLIEPILHGVADYTKGNRFDSIDDLAEMPRIRIIGNAILSIMSKFSTGYWSINDPTNGFTAISRGALDDISLAKLQRRFFFESDMLFRLSLSSRVVSDVKMTSRYRDEKSNLKVLRVIPEFIWRHAVNTWKRIFYQYFLREWNPGTFELPVGFVLLAFGVGLGAVSYQQALSLGSSITAGQVTVSSMSVILGVQLILAFINYDVGKDPSKVR